MNIQRQTLAQATIAGHVAAFVVIDKETGHEYRIYSDGHIEGFPDSASIVVNRIPSIVREAVNAQL